MIEDRSQLETVQRAGSGCWTTIGVHGDLSCPELAKVVHCWNCSVFHSAAGLFFDRPAPADYRTERTRELAEPDELEDKEKSSLLVFRLGSEWLALDLERVVEATAVRPVHSIPRRTNKVLLGLVNLRGRIQLCISLHGLLDVAGEAQHRGQAAVKTRLVVIEGEGGRYVFPSDEVVGVERVAQSELRGVPATLALSGSGHLESTFVFRGATTGVLEPGKLFRAIKERIR